MLGIGRLPVILRIRVAEHSIFYVQRCSELSGVLKAQLFMDEGPFVYLFPVLPERGIM